MNRPHCHLLINQLTRRLRMSREEREEAYNKARERIFGTASTETSTPGMHCSYSLHFQQR